MRLTLGVLAMLAQQVAMLQQRLEAADLGGPPATGGTSETAATLPGDRLDGERPDEPTPVNSPTPAGSPGERVGAEQPGEPPAGGEVATADALAEYHADAPSNVDEPTTEPCAPDGDLPSPGIDVATADGSLEHHTETLLAAAMAAEARSEHSDLDDAHIAREVTLAAGFPRGRGDHEIAIVDATSPAPPVQELSLTLGRWNFATVIFLLMFEQGDTVLARVMVLKAVAWLSDSGARVELTGEKPWPWLADLLGTGRLDGLACAGFLVAGEAWVPMQAEAIDERPRGPPLVI